MNNQIDSSELQALLSYTTNDTQFAKNRQWAIPNYTLLIFGGVFAVVKLINEFNFEGLLLIVLSVFLTFAAAFVLWIAVKYLLDIHKVLFIYRCRLKKIYFSSKCGLQDILEDTGVIKQKEYPKFERNWQYPFNFIVLLCGSFLLLFIVIKSVFLKNNSWFWIIVPISFVVYILTHTYRFIFRGKNRDSEIDALKDKTQQLFKKNGV